MIHPMTSDTGVASIFGSPEPIPPAPKGLTLTSEYRPQSNFRNAPAMPRPTQPSPYGGNLMQGNMYMDMPAPQQDGYNRMANTVPAGTANRQRPPSAPTYNAGGYYPMPPMPLPPDPKPYDGNNLESSLPGAVGRPPYYPQRPPIGPKSPARASGYSSRQQGGNGRVQMGQTEYFRI